MGTKHYTLKLKPEANTFALNRFGYFEFVDATEEYEIYEFITQYDVDTIIDTQCQGVIEWDVIEKDDEDDTGDN